VQTKPSAFFALRLKGPHSRLECDGHVLFCSGILIVHLDVSFTDFGKNGGAVTELIRWHTWDPNVDDPSMICQPLVPCGRVG